MQQTLSLSTGTTVHYWTHRSELKATIIMIHGITGNHEGFQYIEPLLDTYRLIIPDLPGFGVSDLPVSSEWSIEDLARLTNEFIAKLDLTEPPIILGHSMGGLVVSAMVAQSPGLFGDIVLISPVPTRVTKRDSRYIGATLGGLHYKLGSRLGKPGEKLVKSRTISAVTTNVMTKTFDSKRKKDIQQHHFDNLERISSSAFYYAHHQDINRQGAIDYADILKKKRVALIVGDDDIVTPLDEEKKLAAAIEPAQFTVISGVGHLIHYEKAAEAAKAIKAFLSPRQSSH